VYHDRLLQQPQHPPENKTEEGPHSNDEHALLNFLLCQCAVLLYSATM